MVTDERKRFLDRFEWEYHGAVSNYFYQTVRAEKLTATRPLCSALLRRLRAGLAEGYENRRPVIEAVLADPEAALDFMAWIVEREKRSATVKAQEKVDRAEYARQRSMEERPVSDRQLEVLRKLGVEEHEMPENCWEASQMIDELKTW